MTNRNYAYFETTADIGIKTTADTLEDAFINSALATMNLITDVDKIEKKISDTLHIVSEDKYALLYDWITELMFLMNCDFFIASDYDVSIVKEDNSYVLDARMYGDTYDTERYNYKTEVKAITYHQMLIEEDDNMVHIEFIVDI